MTILNTSPCDWPVDYSGQPDSQIISDDSKRLKFERLATDYLWRWTGRRFGLCEVEISPCRVEEMSRVINTSTYYESPSNGLYWSPVTVLGSIRDVICGNCSVNPCKCGRADSIEIPGPVDSIEEIWIDGELLDPNAYKVEGLNRLIRLDGGTWPTRSDASKELDQPGTWGVRYKIGIPVPLGGQVAAARLAIEFAKALNSDPSCQLPQRIQSITRQGVTVAVLDSFDDIDTGHTGIWVVDSWVASVMKPEIRSRVMSPDVGYVKSRRIL